MRHDDECAEAVVLDEVQATGEPVDPGVIPRHRECDRRVEQDSEVVPVISALVEVPEVGDEPVPESLLDARFHLVAPAWRYWLTFAKQPVQTVPGGEQQVFVVRRLHGSSV